MNNVHRFPVPNSPREIAFVAADAGIDTLNQLKEGLRLAADLLQRMSDEGGVVLTPQQQADFEEYNELTWRIRRNILPVRRIKF